MSRLVERQVRNGKSRGLFAAQAVVAGMVFSVFSICGAGGLAAEPAAASFDCAKASSAVERAICGNGELAERDRKVSAAYRAAVARFSGEDRADLIANQRSWLEKRDKLCATADNECLTDEYFTREEALNYLAKFPKAALPNILWAKGVVCSGNTALIRFEYTGMTGTAASNAPPDIGGRLGRIAGQREACRLADGRVVRLKTVFVPDAAASGMCGGDNSEIYSVWIGDKKVISREERADKCEVNPVRAVYLEGNRLTLCQDEIGLLEDKPSNRSCKDISDRLIHPVHDRWPAGTFLTAFSAPGMKPFCDSRIRDERDNEGFSDPDWPRKTAAPNKPVIAEDAPAIVDLNNSGTSRPAYHIELVSAPSEGSYWIVPPPGMSSVEVKKLTEDPDADIDALRNRGAQVFAGDQTPYEETSYTYLVPFRADNTTWIHARWAIFRLDLPTEVILRPKSDGTQEVVCKYQMTPGL